MWRKTELGNIAIVIPSNVDKKSVAGQKIVNLCNYMDVYNNRYITSDINFMVSTAKSEQVEKYRLNPFDVIITKDSETPEDIAVPSVVVEEIDHLICGYHLSILRPKKAINGKFLMYRLCENTIQRQFFRIANGSTRYGLTIDAIKNISLDLPEQSEQKGIVEILETVDEAIDATQDMLTKQEKIKDGLLQDLLTRGVDKNGKLRPPYTQAPELYKQSPLGMIPKEWEAKTIDELAIHVGSGITPRGGSAVYKKSGITFIRSQNVYNDGLKLNDVAYITNQIHKEMSSSEIFKHDVLLNITGASIGRCCPVPSNLGVANVNQHVCAIRIPKATNEDAKYLSMTLSSFVGQDQIARFNAGSNREGLNFQQIRSFNIPWPDEVERTLIADTYTLYQSEKQNTLDELSKLKKLKAGLMQDLLTGKKRIPLKQEKAA